MLHTSKWKQTKSTIFAFTLIAALLPLLAGCGGGGAGGTTTSDGAVTALDLPGRIQLSSVDDSAGTASADRSVRSLFYDRGLSRSAYSDAGTDYSNATKDTWVDDTDALNMINTILGVCAETGYENFVNDGPYLALVRDDDENKQSQSGSSTTATTTEELMEIIVDVTRASNSAPMIIKVWLFVNGPEDSPMLVRGYFTVSQGVSSDYPYGVMEAHFKGNQVGQDGSIGADVIMEMALSVNAENGSVVMENVDDEGDPSGMWEAHRKVRVVANADLTQGNAYVSDQETECDQDGCSLPAEPTIAQITFNEDYFKETVDGVSVTYDKNQFSRRIYRYQLFDADTGTKISLNSGFPIQTEDGRHGYVGYYGLWMNNNGSLDHGATVTDMNGDSYTVFRSAGKLSKHTRDSMPLSGLNGMELSKYNCDNDGCNDMIVAWNSTSEVFETKGYRDQSNGQIVYDTTGLPTTVTFDEWDGAWCEPLKAYLRLGALYADSATPGNSSIVNYHAEQTLSPDDAADLVNVPLYTWEFTMDADASGINQLDVDDYNTAQQNYWMNLPTQKTFYFDPATMMLEDVNGHAISLDGLTISDGSNLQWGYHVGPLTTDPLAPDTLWQAYEQTVYYTWNTGTDDWNQLVAVKNANGQFVSFDPPVSFGYTHATANDANGLSTYDGKKFRIEYDGFSLNMPWAFNDDLGDWEPLINIKDGVEIGTYTNSDGISRTCVVKGIEQALIMAEAADPGSVNFADEAGVGAPSLTYDATKTALVGDVPTGVELKVIKGEVIE